MNIRESGLPVGYLNHMGIMPYAQPFSILDGRVWFVATHSSGYVHPNSNPLDLTGTQPGEESFMCLQIPLDNLSPTNVPFPAAQWDFGQCVVKQALNASAVNGTLWVNGHTIYQTDTAVFVLSSGASTAGQSSLEWVPLPRLTRLEFGDAGHRWRHEEFHDLAGFAGGTPFVYMTEHRTYEMSTALHAPVPIGWDVVPGGSLTVDKILFMKTAMLYIDGPTGASAGANRVALVQVTPITFGLKQTAQIFIMPVTTTMKR